MIGRVHDEDDFADKFPFLEERRLQREEEERKQREEDEKREAELARMQVKVVVGKRPEELARERYEQEMKKMNERIEE